MIALNKFTWKEERVVAGKEEQCKKGKDSGGEGESGTERVELRVVTI